MRLALISDVHGNSIALDAVLSDVEAAGGVDAYWVLGDLVALGPDPVGVLRRLADLPGLECARGNTDRYVVTGDRPPPTVEDAQREPSLMPTVAEIAATFAWTLGCVATAGWLEWLAGLPLELRRELPDGTRLLGVHPSPGRDEGSGLAVALDDPELRELVDGCDADLICAGHTHVPVDRRIDGIRVFNLGSLSNPATPDLRASYAILDATTDGYVLDPRHVEYDHEAVIAATLTARHPGAAFIVGAQRGESSGRLPRG